MKILITGTTGYIAKRLALKLLAKGHYLVCCVRDLDRIPDEIEYKKNIEFIKVDFLNIQNIQLPKGIEVAYYLIHSMSSSSENFDTLEKQCATNFKKLTEKTNCQQVIYLSGIVNAKTLSKHLQSRFNVEKSLKSNSYSLTTFRAGIIVGSGSSSFEIIRDIVEKLPIIIAPTLLNTKTQPIAIRDVLLFLSRAVGRSELYNNSYDIFGPEVLTYKKMLQQFADFRGFKRYIITVPFISTKISSSFLYFITSTSYYLASSLVDSMKTEVIGKPSNINKLLEVEPITYKVALSRAFQRIKQNAVISSWKDAMSSGIYSQNNQIKDFINVPHFGCFKDVRHRDVTDEEYTLNKIWAIGGKNGWYSYNWLWKIRGYFDKLVGGVGLRRGRTHDTYLEPGDPLDFWRVLLADKKQKRLLLFAEMKLPGEAWLEFKIVKNKLYQRAVFRPKGILGRLYWYSVLPFHSFVFKGMIDALVSK